MNTLVKTFIGEGTLAEAAYRAEADCNAWLTEQNSDSKFHDPKVAVRMVLPSMAVTANRVCFALTVHYEVIKN